MEQQPTSNHKKNTISLSDELLTILRIGISVLVVMIGIFVALSPSVCYAPVPKVVLYTLISLLPAILFGVEATAKFQLDFKAFSFTTVGAAAITFGMLFSLTYLSKPEQQIAVFHIYDEQGQPVLGLNRQDAIKVLLTEHAYQVTTLIDENTLVLIFPEQVDRCELQLQPISSGTVYSGTLQYSGNRESKLYLGKQLTSISEKQRL